jgi:hypothetical protein
MKRAICLVLVFFSTLVTLKSQKIPVPENYTVLDSVYGDLDKDSINELVVAYNIGEESEYEGVPRELVIYKLENNQWVEWKKSRQALLGSQDGGMMGDPYEQMIVKNGILIIKESGGSSWKWASVDKYRFQHGEFYLIGYTQYNGKSCEYWQEVDFNLVTGQMIIDRDYEECEHAEPVVFKNEIEVLYEIGLKITLQKRNEKDIIIVSPKYKFEIFISVGTE